MDVTAFWKDVLAQDAQAIRKYFHTDAVINWHCTNERFTVEEFLAANCDYPGEWDGAVERIETVGDLYITVTKVYPMEQSAFFHAVSFIRVRDGRIAAMDEYWADDGPPPEWRTGKKLGTAIR